MRMFTVFGYNIALSFAARDFVRKSTLVLSYPTKIELSNKAFSPL